MTEGKAASAPREKKRYFYIFIKFILKTVFYVSVGFVMSVTRLPFDTFPLGIGAVCAASDFPLAVLVGVLAGNAFSDVRWFTVAAAAAFVFRIGVTYISGAYKPKRDGLMIRDKIGMRMFSAFVGAAVAAVWMYVSSPETYTIIGAVFCVSTAVFSTAVFSFFFDSKLRYTNFFPIGVIAVFLCVSLPLRGYFVAQVPVDLVFCVVSTLLISFMWGGAYGGVAGLLMGIALGWEWMPLLALTGLAAGFFSATVGAFAAEIASFAVYICGVIYFFGTENLHIYLIPAIIGETLTAIPYAIGLIGRVPTRADGVRDISGEIISAIREEENKKRMEMLSKAMRSLSEVIGGLTEKIRRRKTVSFEAMCREVWSRNCADCPIDCKCHDIGSIPGDSAIDNIAEKLMMAGGRIDKDRIGEFVAPKCPKIENIISGVNDGAAAIVSSLSGDDGIDIMTLDYGAMAEMLADALSQCSGKYEPDKIMSEKVRRALLGAGFAAQNVVVCGDRKTYIIATGEEILRSGVGAEDIRRICENVCRKKFKVPTFRMENGHAAMIVEADAGFFTEYAGKQSAKRGENVSGDSVSVVRNDDGYFYSFICDGMGSGEVAAVTSMICRVFLEKMLECGNSKSATLRMLNTFIRNKGVECYATVDLLEIDLMQGTASFIKSGATPSYVKRGQNIFKIESSTLPVGIMREISAEMTEFELCDGDVIILCSDGVAQDFDVSASLDPSWFVSFVEREWTDDLERMAEKIIFAAAQQNHQSDDMTVELVRIRKKDAATDIKMLPVAMRKAE